MRVVAAFDYDRACAIACWPLREMLIGYAARQREGAIESHQLNQILYQIRMVWGGKEKPPETPALIRDPTKQ